MTKNNPETTYSIPFRTIESVDSDSTTLVLLVTGQGIGQDKTCYMTRTIVSRHYTNSVKA